MSDDPGSSSDEPPPAGTAPASASHRSTPKFTTLVLQRRLPLLRAVPAIVMAIGVAAVIGYVIFRGNDDIVARYGEYRLKLSELNELVVESPDSALRADQATADRITDWLLSHAARQELIDRGGIVQANHVADGTIRAEALGAVPGTRLHQLWSNTVSVLNAVEDFAESSAVSRDVVPEYLCASHVVVADEEQAQQIKDRADAGENVGDLAAEFSIEPAADPENASRGDLGCADTALYVTDFVEGARSAEGSGVVGPIRSDFGWHVIDVRSMGPVSVLVHPELTQADVDEAIAEATLASTEQGVEMIFTEVIEGAFGLAATAEIDSRFGTWDPTANYVVAGR